MLRFAKPSMGNVSMLVAEGNNEWCLTSIFPFAHSRLDTTPSRTSLMLLTLASSLFNDTSLACSASYLDSPFRCGASADLMVGLGFCLEAREGDAKRSSLSESERSNLPTSGVDMVK